MQEIISEKTIKSQILRAISPFPLVKYRPKNKRIATAVTKASILKYYY